MDLQPLVVIPAFNEEANLPEVLREIRALHPQYDLLVVDDGSTDRSAAVAREAGSEVISHAANRGYGASLCTGYRYALERRYEVIIRMDGDGQHDPAGIAGLVGALKGGNCDIAIGSRMLPGGGGYKPSFQRRVGIAFFAWLGRRLMRAPLTDPTSGFAAMNRRAAAFLIDHSPHDFPDLCMRVALHRAGLKSVETPVRMRPRRSGSSMLGSGLAPYIYVPKMLFYLAQVYARPAAQAPTEGVDHA